jgi:hypothetical protein
VKKRIAAVVHFRATVISQPGVALAAQHLHADINISS